GDAIPTTHSYGARLATQGDGTGHVRSGKGGTSHRRGREPHLRGSGGLPASFTRHGPAVPARRSMGHLVCRDPSTATIRGSCLGRGGRHHGGRGLPARLLPSTLKGAMTMTVRVEAAELPGTRRPRRRRTPAWRLLLGYLSPHRWGLIVGW